MHELHERFDRAIRSGEFHPLLLAGCYVFDFLAIHPFRDGNGRMGTAADAAPALPGRLRGRPLCQPRAARAGAAARRTTSARVRRGSAGTRTSTTSHRGLNYFLGIVTAAYKEFESRVGVVAGRGSKREAIRQFVRQSIAEEFTVADVRRAAPAASQSYISKTLASMRDEGLIEPIGAGKNAHWRRLRSEF